MQLPSRYHWAPDLIALHASAHWLPVQARAVLSRFVLHVAGSCQQLPDGKMAPHVFLFFVSWLQVWPALHGVATAPPHDTCWFSGHAPLLEIAIPLCAATVALKYVTPSQPHCGLSTAVSFAGFWTQVPVWQFGVLQYIPSGHGSIFPHVHAIGGLPASGHEYVHVHGFMLPVKVQPAGGAAQSQTPPVEDDEDVLEVDDVLPLDDVEPLVPLAPLDVVDEAEPLLVVDVFWIGDGEPSTSLFDESAPPHATTTPAMASADVPKANQDVFIRAPLLGVRTGPTFDCSRFKRSGLAARYRSGDRSLGTVRRTP